MASGNLIVTRKEGQKTFLERGDERIELYVSELRPGRVKIGIRADKSWNIVREEAIQQPPLQQKGA